MPYDLESPPEKLRGHPPKTQRQWIHVYESCMAKHGEDVRCQKMAWGVTGGWKKEKGFDPNDPDRDILLEMEVAAQMEEEGMGFSGLDLTERELQELLLANKIGLSVELE